MKSIEFLFFLILVTMSLRAAEMVRFDGIMIIRGKATVLVFLDDERNKWCAVGDKIGPYTVTEIKADEEKITLRDSEGSESQVRLSRSIIRKTGIYKSKSAPTLTDPKNLNWAWIRSDANPMRKQPEPLPEWAVLVWQSSGEDFRIGFKNYYRAHGWELSRVELKDETRSRQDFDPIDNPFDPPRIKDPSKMKTAVLAVPFPAESGTSEEARKTQPK